MTPSSSFLAFRGGSGGGGDKVSQVDRTGSTCLCSDTLSRVGGRCCPSGPGARSSEAPGSTRSCLHNCRSRKGQERIRSPAHVTTAGTVRTAIPPETHSHLPREVGPRLRHRTQRAEVEGVPEPGTRRGVGSAPNALSPAHLLGQKEVTWRMRQGALGWHVASIKEQAPRPLLSGSPHGQAPPSSAGTNPQVDTP